MRRVLALLVTALLAACTSVDFEGAEQALDIQPRDVDELGVESGTVVWGGRIVATANLEDSTELQVLAYPLTGGHAPKPEQRSVGRFVVVVPEFLEPLEFSPGRFVSMAGQLQGMTLVSEGEYDRSVPLVRSTQVHLWPRDPSAWQSRVSFGVGVGIYR